MKKPKKAARRGTKTAAKKATTRKPMTAKERAAYNKRWRENYHSRWAKDRNKVRRETYQSDEAYREAMKTAARQAYRDKQGGEVRSTDCRENIPDLDTIGEVRKCTIDGVEVMQLCFTGPETATALMLSRSGFLKWLASGVIPRPVVNAEIEFTQTLVPKNGGKKKTREGVRFGDVFTEPELTAIMEIVGEHHSRIAYLRPSAHPEVVEAIHKAVAKVREDHGIE